MSEDAMRSCVLIPCSRAEIGKEPKDVDFGPEISDLQRFLALIEQEKVFNSMNCRGPTPIANRNLVPVRGFEPRTSSLRMRRSTN